MVSDTDWTLLWRFETLKVTLKLPEPSGIRPPPVPANESALTELAASKKLNASTRRSTILDFIISFDYRPAAAMSPGICILNLPDKQMIEHRRIGRTER